MPPQTEQQTVTRKVLSNILRSRDNQMLKLGQLEYNMRNIFLEKLCTTFGR